MPKLIRVTTVPIALKYLLAGQMRYMKENGYDVIMVSADGEGREDLEKQEGCEHHIIPMTRTISPFADLRSLWKMYKFLKKEKPDIVHSHTPKAGLIAMVASKWAGVKIRIHTVAGLRFMTSKGLTRKLLMRMEKITAHHATHIWPNSFSLLNYIKDTRLLPVKKMEVIGFGSSNGINLSRFSPENLEPVRVQTIKKDLNYDPQHIYMLCVGRIVKDKGIKELVHTFARLYKSNNRLRLILVGSYEDHLDPIGEETKEILTTHPGIIMTGWRNDVEYFMHISFALIHPSYREGFPNVLLQAGAMYCPVICSRIEGNVDIVDDKETGLLFEAQNEESLYQVLRNALTIPDDLNKYAIGLRRKIEEKFDQKILHGKIKDKYSEIITTYQSHTRNRKTTIFL
ncbi:MAG: glycosyltransferase family 4 protein [Bacteroidetes bacterium]|nr:glycosyltransferase family 4 protein [Bacteroidota bacterium]MBS1930853.1 glycosyltransferase family 4 protein [Bacteroidota bacterium]